MRTFEDIMEYSDANQVVFNLLRQKYYTSEKPGIVPFIGAGLSKLTDDVYPLWGQALSELNNYMGYKRKSEIEGLLNSSEDDRYMRVNPDVYNKINFKDLPISKTNQSLSRDLICNYVITNNRDAVNDIRNNTISVSYFKDVIYYSPEILANEISYFQSGGGFGFTPYSTFKNKEEYLRKYPNVKEIKDNVSYYDYERPFTNEELDKFNNDIYKALKENNYDINQIVQRGSYYNGCSDEFDEVVRTAELYLCFLSIYNNTDDFLQLDKLVFSTQFSKAENILKFPSAMIPAKTAVFVPISVMAEPLDSINYEVLKSEDNYTKTKYEVQNFEQVHMENIQFKKGMLPIGKSIVPIGIKYIMNKKDYLYTEVHSLDANNLYRISRGFEIGSCPHIFYLDEQNTLKYLVEIFSKNYGISNVEKNKYSKECKKLIIAELENETTYIESIYIDEKKLFGAVILNKGEKIEIDIRNNVLLCIKGYYFSPINPANTQIRLEKNKILKKFEYNYKFQNSFSI